ncbi:MAG TPA: preprotein translocase subunit SecG [Candidatus Saccharimonadales bacterium]|nr:preprotein translocase subunit SecG [Candidatus Saccharimonadales bacterium]HSX49211.1 preprotein translocase subunit SecG [Candidatus Saccharimonadales bacterium]
MTPILSVLQVVVSLLLILVILIQVKGVGLGRVWGSSFTSFSRRGLEGFIFKATFVLVFLFLLLSILHLVS